MTTCSSDKLKAAEQPQLLIVWWRLLNSRWNVVAKLSKAPCSLCTACISAAQYVSYSSSASWLAAVGNLSNMNHESRDEKECSIANQLQHFVQCSPTFMQASSWLNRQRVVLVQGYNFIWIEGGSRAEQQLNSESLWTVYRHPARMIELENMPQ